MISTPLRQIILCGLLAAGLSACATQRSPNAPPTSPATLLPVPLTIAPSTPTPAPPASATVAIAASPTPTSAPTLVPTLAPTVGGPSTLGRHEGVELVAQADLGQRGWNAGLALAPPCAYIGNRRLPQIAIVDIRDPAQPLQLDPLVLAPGSQAIELRTVPDLHLLVVLNASPDLSFITFDITDCAHPRALGALGLGAVAHEFFLWRDPAQPARLLLYAAMWDHRQPDLHVLDLTDPTNLIEIGAWTAAADGAAGALHSLNVSPDGRTAYLALWEGGLLLADTSDFAAGLPNPQLRLLRTPDGALAPMPGVNVHSAVPLTDPRYLLVPQEVYDCPFGGLLIADVTDPARPQRLARFALPENDPACAALPEADAVFTSHNPLVVDDLVFITWYGGGLQVLDLSVPADPRRVGLYVPSGAGAAAASYIGRYPAQLWSYPILDHGLLYVVDIQSGLHILRYTGPGAAAVAATLHAESNVTLLP